MISKKEANYIRDVAIPALKAMKKRSQERIKILEQLKKQKCMTLAK